MKTLTATTKQFFGAATSAISAKTAQHPARPFATVMPHAASSAPTVTPFPRQNGLNMGATVTGADLNNLSDDAFQTIRNALYSHTVVVLKDQAHLTPKAQFELTQRFDPDSTNYGHGKTLDAKKSILHPDLKTIPHQPQVQVIGNGPVAEFEGLKDIRLKHPHHRTFHKTIVPEAEDLDVTRYYRWHIDAALYGLNPPLVTSLMAVKVPKGRRQTLRYDDGSGDTKDVPLGTTAFASSYTAYDILTDAQKEFVRTTTVQYAPHPYIWMSKAKALSDGLGLHSDGAELSYEELPAIEQEKIQVLPMTWKNPVTGQLALQVHPCAIEKLHLADGTVIDDLKEVRRIVHDLQRPAIAPELVYAHDWDEGDLVLFNNHGCLHSVVGAFAEDEVRIFRQCNLAASRAPYGPEVAVTA